MPRSRAQRERERNTVASGNWVYADTPHGVVRARVLSITTDSVCVAVTETVGTYERGSVAWFGHHEVVPRGRVYRRGGRRFITAGPLTFVTDDGRRTIEVVGREVV